MILISVKESDSQLIAGVPEYVDITTNQVANIFYTVDGSTPTEDSTIYIERLYLPTDGLAFTFKVKAFIEESHSDVLEIEYGADQSEMSKFRLVGEEGVQILPYGEDAVDNLSFDEDGNETQKTAIEFEDLEMVASTQTRQGLQLSGTILKTETTLDFVKIPDKIIPNYIRSRTSVHSANFDPQAHVIEIDGSTDEKMRTQVVKILNRPFDTMETKFNPISERIYQRADSTSSFVRAMYNPENGIACFYYFDSQKNRWIISKQSISPKKLSLFSKVSTRNRLVFKWIDGDQRTFSQIL